VAGAAHLSHPAQRPHPLRHQAPRLGLSGLYAQPGSQLRPPAGSDQGAVRWALKLAS